MFLITPKSKPNLPNAANSFSAPSIQPLAKITKASRVATACDRCRIKKVKCDGDMPCLRCSQDEAPCIVSKKPAATDPKGILREYVYSMESQQTRLIKALQKVHRHVRQAVEEEDMKDIVDIVRACGFDFEGVSDLSKNHTKGEIVKATHNEIDQILENKANLSPAKGPSSDKDQVGIGAGSNIPKTRDGRPKKRKREVVNERTDATLAQSSSSPHGVNDPGSSDSDPDRDYDQEAGLPQQKMRKFPTSIDPLTDDYWDFENYSDMVAGPYTPTPNSIVPFSASMPTLSAEEGSQNTSYMNFDWPVLDGSLPEPIYNANDPDPFPFLDNLLQVSLGNFPALPDLDSTMWWDPSLVFDLNGEGSDYGYPSQSTPKSDLSNALKESNSEPLSSFRDCP